MRHSFVTSAACAIVLLMGFQSRASADPVKPNEAFADLAIDSMQALHLPVPTGLREQVLNLAHWGTERGWIATSIHLGGRASGSYFLGGSFGHGMMISPVDGDQVVLVLEREMAILGGLGASLSADADVSLVFNSAPHSREDGFALGLSAEVGSCVDLGAVSSVGIASSDWTRVLDLAQAFTRNDTQSEQKILAEIFETPRVISIGIGTGTGIGGSVGVSVSRHEEMDRRQGLRSNLSAMLQEILAKNATHL